MKNEYTNQDRRVSKQKLYLLLLEVILIVALAGVALYLATPSIFGEPNLNLAKFRRVERGMSVSEVNSIFGMRGKKGPCMQLECSWTWQHGDNFAEICFSQRDGKVSGGYFVTPDGKQHWLSRDGE
jgi:hypothetical protein